MHWHTPVVCPEVPSAQSMSVPLGLHETEPLPQNPGKVGGLDIKDGDTGFTSRVSPCILNEGRAAQRMLCSPQARHRASPKGPWWADLDTAAPNLFYKSKALLNHMGTVTDHLYMLLHD